MADIITDEMAAYAAELIDVELSLADKEQVKQDMQEMLNYIDLLDELDTSEAKPVSHLFSKHNVFREDMITNTDDRENILKNAPESKAGMFRIPEIFE